ncbi:hypothetical protein [Listeria cornellensis]|uniref:Uncharacterized protein n=1 Tax=Listeria cornellensis FSL F6-0969 TaxID=1265820 RepID=W7C7D5_9LIST|nr:hypothetical protein [Listeria cornellensis]EUJ31606.1 hypothetical protein PCORN_04697 [Listeria cornellensis FSL F6-0969]
MKKTFAWVSILAIVLQLFLPQIIYAIPTDGLGKKALTLTDITIKDQEVLPTNEIDTTLQGAVKTGNEQQNIRVTLSDNVVLTDESGELKDAEQQVIGSYVTHLQEIVLTINPNVEAKIVFPFKGQLEDTDEPKVTVEFDIDGEKTAKEVIFKPDEPKIDVVTPNLEKKTSNGCWEEATVETCGSGY